MLVFFKVREIPTDNSSMLRTVLLWGAFLLVVLAVVSSLFLSPGSGEKTTEAATSYGYGWLVQATPDERDLIASIGPPDYPQKQAPKITIQEHDLLWRIYERVASTYPLTEQERVAIQLDLVELLEFNGMLRVIDGVERLFSSPRFHCTTAQNFYYQMRAEAFERHNGVLPRYIERLLHFYWQVLKAAGCEESSGTVKPLTLPEEGRNELFRNMRLVIICFVEDDEMGADDIQDLVEEWWPEEWNGRDGGPVWKSWQDFIESLR